MKYLSFGGFRKLESVDRAEFPLTSPYKEHSLAALRRIRSVCAQSWSDPGFGAAGRDAYHAATRGQLPKGLSGDMIVLSCDSGYFDTFAKYMIFSHKRLSEAAHIHLHLTLPTPKAKAELAAIQDALGAHAFSCSVAESDLYQVLRYPNVYLTCARFIHSQRLMAQNAGRFIHLDVDGVFRAPIAGFIDTHLADADMLLIRRRHKLKPSRKVLASALVVADTALGRRFADAYSRALVALLAEGPQYHIDQTAMHYVLKAAEKEGLKARDMGLDLADHDFRKSALIWSAKGRKRKASPEFQSLLNDARTYYERCMAGRSD